MSPKFEYPPGERTGDFLISSQLFFNTTKLIVYFRGNVVGNIHGRACRTVVMPTNCSLLIDYCTISNSSQTTE